MKAKLCCHWLCSISFNKVQFFLANLCLSNWNSKSVIVTNKVPWHSKKHLLLFIYLLFSVMWQNLLTDNTLFFSTMKTATTKFLSFFYYLLGFVCNATKISNKHQILCLFKYENYDISKLNNFFSGTHDVYHKESFLFLKAMHFIFNHKKK